MLFSSVEKSPRLSEFEMEVPEKLIAQDPEKKRDNCKLMVMNTKENTLEHKKFYDIIQSDWYEKTLIDSWNKTHPFHLPRCYLSCGDFAKRKVIK